MALNLYSFLKLKTMIKKIILPAALLLFAINTFAQQPIGALTIFSEDGDKFFLILNGEKQNNIAQTNLRVEDLPQPYYTAKIIFEDKTLPEINKKNIMVTDADGIFADVTYKIKHDKEGNPKMSSIPYSTIPIRQGYVAPSNVYVTHYGTPIQATTYTQTTTTTVGTPSANANINIGGINMNVNINDPFDNEIIETTTTTTTSNNTSTNTPKQVGCNNTYAISIGNFASALATIKKQSFEDVKLSTAKQIASSNCLSTNQIVEICNTFNFEESKLDFAKFAYNHCTDINNYFKVNNVFKFSSSADNLNEYLQTK